MPACSLATGRAFALGPAAIEEAMITLATLLKHFHFRTIEERARPTEMIATLRPEGGIWLMKDSLE